MLGILGGLIIASGLGLGFYASRLGKSKTRSLD
jgi:hypothetical protein